MTKFYVDEREVPPPMDLSSLANVLKQIEDACLPPNAVVRQIHIDGIPLTTDELSGNSSEMLQHLEARGKIEIHTGTMGEIARDSIVEALDYLDRIEAATPSLASSFQFSPGPESFENLRQLYEGLYWLNLLLERLQTGFHILLEDAVIQGVPAREHHRKFIAVLKQMIDSQEKSDFALIADLIEYEILPMVPVWREMFKIICEKARIAQ